MHRATTSKLEQQAFDFFEVGEIAGTSYWSVWRAAERGLIRSIWMDGRRMVAKSEVDHILAHGFGRRGRPRRKLTQPPAPATTDATAP